MVDKFAAFAFETVAPVGRFDQKVQTAGTMHTLYKICPAALWREAERAGVFHGSEVDRRDNFEALPLGDPRTFREPTRGRFAHS